MTDDKPPINLAYERKARSRDFALEYKQLMTNGRNIGLDDASCKAFANEVQLWDMLVFEAATMFELQQIEPTADAVFDLAQALRIHMYRMEGMK